MCLKMDDMSVEISKEINILGIMIDSWLTFASRVKTAVMKAGRKLFSIRRISKIINFKSIKSLFKSSSVACDVVLCNDLDWMSF